MYALEDFIAQTSEAFKTSEVDRAMQQVLQPRYVKIKLTFTCNLRCLMCNHWRETRPPPMAAERMRQIIGELAELGCRKIHFSGGEPLLCAEIVDLVAYASSLGIRVALTTNGTLVDKSMARELVCAGLRSVNVSLDSPLRKLHDALRGRNGAWKKATRAVQLFRRYADKGKIVVRMNTVVHRLNYKTLVTLPQLAHDLGVDVINLIAVDDHFPDPMGEGAPVPGGLLMHRAHIERYNLQIAPQLAAQALALGLMTEAGQAYPFGSGAALARYASRGYYAAGWYQSHPCFAPWLHSLIDYNGLVYACCMTREQMPPLGDLTQSSFAEIWNGLPYQRLRERMSHPPALPQCRRCDDFLEQNKQLAALFNRPC